MVETVTVPSLVTAPAICELFGIHYSTLQNWLREGRFPRPVPLSRGQGRRRYWRAADVKTALEEKAQ